VIMRPMPVPPPVTTAVNLETSNSLEVFRSSFERFDGLVEDIVLVRMVKDDGLTGNRCGSVNEGLVRALSIVFSVERAPEVMTSRHTLLVMTWAHDDVERYA